MVLRQLAARQTCVLLDIGRRPPFDRKRAQHHPGGWISNPPFHITGCYPPRSMAIPAMAVNALFLPSTSSDTFESPLL